MRGILFAARFLLVVTLLAGLGCETADIGFRSRSSTRSEVKGSRADVAGGLQVSFRLEQDRVVLNQPIILRQSISNNSADSVQIDLGPAFKQDISFKIGFPDGREETVSLPPRDGLALLGRIRLETGESFEQRLVLNEWVNLTMIGRYSVQGILNKAGPNRSVPLIPVVHSPTISFMLEKEDAGHLQAISAWLISDIEDSKTGTEASTAALALAYVENDVALPYLVKAFHSTKKVEIVIFSVLAKRGTPLAMKVFTTIANESSDPELRARAKTGLELLRAKQRDPTTSIKPN